MHISLGQIILITTNPIFEENTVYWNCQRKRWPCATHNNIVSIALRGLQNYHSQWDPIIIPSRLFKMF